MVSTGCARRTVVESVVNGVISFSRRTLFTRMSRQLAVEYLHVGTLQINVLSVCAALQYSTTRPDRHLPIQRVVLISLPHDTSSLADGRRVPPRRYVPRAPVE